jgi:transcription elongation factor S-II
MSRKISNPEQFRENIRNKLIPILEDENISINIEKAVFNYAIQEAGFKKIIKKWDNGAFVQLYIDRLRTIYLNLKNSNILSQIKSKELAPHAFVFMTHQEMNPNRWKELIDKKSIIDANKYNNNVVANTDMFTCSKCKSKQCTYYSLQTRSADESETIFITCCNCGRHWKKN